MTKTILHELVSKSPALRARTRQLYLGDIDRFLAFVGDDPERWTRAATRAFYQHLLDAKMKPKSANRIMCAVTYAGKWYAVETGKADFSQIQLAPDGLSVAREALTDEQAQLILTTCEPRTPRDLRDFPLLITALETGMRRMSLAGMAWESITKDPPSAIVPLKGRDEPYAVPLSDAAVLSLRPWRGWLDGRKEPKRGPVFRALYHQIAGPALGAGISTTSVYNIIRERAALVGLTKIHPHIFRHTFVTWRVAAGLSNSHIAAITGHELPGSNSGQLYNYTDKKFLADVARNSTPGWLGDYVSDFVKRS